ncbi:PEPxxWA-CTERM sorting domain-containing protein [Sphingomonas azotifigens]|uniref:PEPxxWA-CTERM sorting domain-containing protein n=1 Tax=Sphingomonas azotifigens TaxID=330920 RepID=UPI001FE39117|nr:PEPxxWA-CTERM sorting domain-containing protein [Sphingomonas azotifigens]
MNIAAVFGIACFAVVTIASPSSADTIDTSGPYVDRMYSFGRDATPTYGQTFTVGTENALNAFTFYLGGDATNVRAYVYSWTGYGAVGPALFASDVRSFGGTSGNAFDALEFSVGALDLIRGQHYVAFLTTVGVDQPANAGSAWMPTAGTFGSDAYGGGDFVYTNNGPAFANVVGQRWDDSNGALGDVQFKAVFSAGATSGAGVPEPAAWAMLIGGFGLAGGALRRRRVRTAVRFA